jgi:hypothetical protein
VCSAGSTVEQKFFHSWEVLGTIESCELCWRPRGAGLEGSPMHMQLWNTALLIADVVKVFNPQSPQARAIFDLAIVVIAMMVVIFAIVVGIAREDCGTARQLLVSDSSATVLGYFFLDCRAPKK